MPRRPPSVCTAPGCGVLVPLGKGPCGAHRLEARRASDAKRPSARQRGYDSKWEKTRKAYLKANPYCVECDVSFLSRATDVDHIDGLGPNGPRGHDWSNLRALCHSHHSQRTARDQPGGWHDGPDAA